MQWLADVALARTGDSEAKERLAEYFGPFVHGVLLAHVPHTAAHKLYEETLRQSLKGLPPDESKAGLHVLAQARKAAQGFVGRKSERSSDVKKVDEARKWLDKVRALPLPAREYAVLRLVEGIPGEEIFEVLGGEMTSVRASLVSGVVGVLRVMGEPKQDVPAAYLWASTGKPTPELARAEMVLSRLRYDEAMHEPDVTEPSSPALLREPETSPAVQVAPSPIGTTRLDPALAAATHSDDDEDEEEEETFMAGARRRDSSTDLVGANSVELALKTARQLRPDIEVNSGEVTASLYAPNTAPTQNAAMPTSLKVWLFIGAVALGAILAMAVWLLRS